MSLTANEFTTFGEASFSVACFVYSLVDEYPSQSKVLNLPSGLYDAPATEFGLNGGARPCHVCAVRPPSFCFSRTHRTLRARRAGLAAAGNFLPGEVAPRNTWYLTSASFNSTTVALYFDGRLQSTKPFGQDFVRRLIVGSNGQGGAFAGAVSQLQASFFFYFFSLVFSAFSRSFDASCFCVQLWNRALAPYEHALLYQGPPVPAPPAPPPSPPAPPPGAPRLRDNFLTLTTSNPPAGSVIITGPAEEVISYTGYCADEYKEQVRGHLAWAPGVKRSPVLAFSHSPTRAHAPLSSSPGFAGGGVSVNRRHHVPERGQ